MKNFLIIFLCVFYISSVDAMPTRGNCEIGNYVVYFEGKGIQIGKKILRDDYVGKINLEFNYICKPFFASTTGITTWRIGSQGLHAAADNNYNLFRTDMNGIIAKSPLPLTTINGKRELWLELIPNGKLQWQYPDHVFFKGQHRKTLFYIYKNGTINTNPGYKFIKLKGSGGTVNNLRFILTDNRGNSRVQSQSFPLTLSIYAYDAFCETSFPSQVKVDGLFADGPPVNKTFFINVDCKDKVTIQNHISTKFTVSPNQNLTLSEDKRTLQFRKNGVKVDMKIHNEFGKIVVFGEELKTNVEKRNEDYSLGYYGAFEAKPDSSGGEFEFTVTLEVTHN